LLNYIMLFKLLPLRNMGFIIFIIFHLKNCNAPSRSFRATKQLSPHPEGAGPPLSIRMGGPNL
jgi:hypothetical protein